MNFASLRFALRMLWRDLRAGELAAVFLALVIAVAALSSVNLFADRVQRALKIHAAELLAANLLINSDHPVPDQFADEAKRRGLRLAETRVFSSMALHPRGAQLVTAKAVSSAYPLLGQLQMSQPAFAFAAAPKPGEVWVDERMAQRTGIRIGQTLQLGNSQLRVAGVVSREPDAALDLFSFVPRVLLNIDDLPGTGLITQGSRVRYRLQMAGPPQLIADYRHWAEPRLGRGERIEDISDARPEVRSAIQKAQRFLGLASMVAVALAVIAIALATRRYVERHLDSAAIMRCLGASQARLWQIYVWQFLLLALAAGLVGALAGALLQTALVSLLGSLVDARLPAPAYGLLLRTVALGSAVMLTFAIPPLWLLRDVPTLRVLRRDLGDKSRRGYVNGLAWLALAGLLYWQVADATVAIYGIVGFAAAALLALALGWLMLQLLRRLPLQPGLGWRYGLANLQRRQVLTLIQILSLSLGLMALLVLTLVRAELLQAWRQSVPSDAPNRFIINIQTEQLPVLKQQFIGAGLPVPAFYPMIRGRLLAVNGQPLQLEKYTDERTRNLAEREFNLSWMAQLPADQPLLDGYAWQGVTPASGFSVEAGLAKTLGIQVGDRLSFDVAGTQIDAPVANLRKVNWDNFRVNFFVISTPDLLQQQASSWICSFYLPQHKQQWVSDVIQQLPNLSVIDVSLILREVQGIIERVVQAVQFVFVLTLLAGMIVLHAALAATQDERLQESAILRTLGASRRQILAVMLSEFALIGALAGFVALLGAAGMGWFVSVRLLELPYSPSLWLPLLAIGGGIGVVMLVGWRSINQVLRVPPLQTLNQMG